MKNTRTIERGSAVRNVLGIAAAAALAGSMAVAPAAAQNQPPADLRTNLTANLAEHTLLAGNATAAILGNRPAEVQAAQAALNQNSSKIAGIVGQLYGGNASGSFLPLWQRHIQHYAEYANALKAGDENGRQQAASNLMQWSLDMGTLFNAPAQFRSGAQAGTNQGQQNQTGQIGNMGESAGMMTQMMQQHVMDTMKVIDAQAANNWPQVYSLAAADVRHMKMVAQTLVNKQGNTAQGAGSDLKANLAMLLIENAALNANATSALINNRIPEHQAASAALKDNTAALSGQLGTVYGGNAYNNLNSVWNNQSLKLAQYANALTSQDVSTQQAARSNVRGFTEEFANGFTQSNAQVPALTLNGWGGTLTTGAINLIDAQDARDFAQEYQLRAQTNQQLLQLTNVLGQAVGQQFPDQYGIPSAPAVPVNVGSVNDNTNVALGSATGADTTAGTGGATTSAGTADAIGASTTGSTTGAGTDAAGTATAGDASAAGSTVLLPTTGAVLGSSMYQVTGTTTTTDTTGTSVTGTTTSTTSGSTTSGSVLLPQTGADLSKVAQQVTGTATTTGTTGTATTGTTTSTTTSSDTSTTGSGSVLLPQTGADLSSVAQQVTGTATTTGTTGTGATSAGTTTTNTTTGGDANTSGSGVLLPQSGADLSQQQQATPNTFVPIALVIAGIALIMAVVLMSFASRDYGQQKRDQ